MSWILAPRGGESTDRSPGVPIQDIWSYQPHTRGTLHGSKEAIDEDVRWFVAQGDKERLGYQTQKPIGLLERVLKSACPADGLVLDPFCGCYMGIEQTMKLLIRMRGGVSETILKSTHNLECLYELLDLWERSVVADYYRVYRSLHNFDAGNTVLETAKQFIQHVGKGYGAWRYILVEDPKRVPKMHLSSMLEIWRVLVDLVQHRVSCPDSQFKPRTLATHLDDYICAGVFRDAYSDNEWQSAVQDENSAVEFGEVKEWLSHKGRPLAAGIDLFIHHARGTGNSIQASSLLRRVLLRAADKACSLVQSGGPFRSVCGRADIAMFHHRIRTGGLVWDANEEVFK